LLRYGRKRVSYGRWKKVHGEHGGKYKGDKHGKKQGHQDDSGGLVIGGQAPLPPTVKYL
jgi:hypothetical protein